MTDRKAHLDAAYDELVQLAADRRARLEESRKLWQFYWDMADEEGWIKEKEQLMSSPDLGHDLTSVHLLLNKHKVRMTTQGRGPVDMLGHYSCYISITWQTQLG